MMFIEAFLNDLFSLRKVLSRPWALPASAILAGEGGDLQSLGVTSSSLPRQEQPSSLLTVLVEFSHTLTKHFIKVNNIP